MPRNQILIRNNKISARLEVLLIEEDEYITAYSPALELSSYGKSNDEAVANFKTELKIFFDETIKMNTFEVYLKKYGWTNDNYLFEPSYSSLNNMKSLMTQYKVVGTRSVTIAA